MSQLSEMALASSQKIEKLIRRYSNPSRRSLNVSLRESHVDEQIEEAKIPEEEINR